MPIELSGFDARMKKAVRHFWRARDLAATTQRSRGVKDQGNRASVTAGKNLSGFVRMTAEIIRDNGIPETDIHVTARSDVTIPGFYRPTKEWDLLVICDDRLVAAIEFKSQVGSFGNNFNNRVEEAIGNATDLKTAFREGAFGESARPFLGYFFVLEECAESTRPVSFSSPHFAAFPEFEETSYAARYDILCRKLVQEELYDAAALVLTDQAAAKTGKYRSLDELTSPRRFAATLAGRIAAEAAR